jgi:hypothetical protein
MSALAAVPISLSRAPPLPIMIAAMGLALDINYATDPRSCFVLFPRFGNDRGDVWQLLGGHLKNLLAHKLGYDDSLRLVGHLIIRIEPGPFRQVVEYFGDEQLRSLAP